MRDRIFLLVITIGLLIGQSSNISARLMTPEPKTPEERLQEKGYNTDKESLIKLILSLSPKDPKDVAIESYVLEALGNLPPDEEVASVLLEILQRPFYSHSIHGKCKVAIALSYHNKEKAIPYLKEVMQKDRGYASLEAACALADVGDSSGYELVIEAYKKEGANPSSIYIPLISKFAKFKDKREDVISILKEYLSHENPIIGIEAAGALADIGDISGCKLVIETLKQSEYPIPPVDQEYAIRVLPKFAKFKDVDVLDLCFKGLQEAIRLGRGHRGGILFKESLSAIEKIGDRRAIPRLESILDNLRKEEKEPHLFIQRLEQTLQILMEEKDTPSISKEKTRQQGEVALQKPSIPKLPKRTTKETDIKEQTTLHLKDGRTITGIITKEDTNTIKINTGVIEYTIDRKDIDRIE